MPIQPSPPVYANFPSEHLTIGAGVAIFHLASQRVVVCYHTRDKYYFLPKGRQNANEECRRAAEREGFEESGYRNRLLPLPMRHRQPDGDEGHEPFVTEAVWTQFMPVKWTIWNPFLCTQGPPLILFLCSSLRARSTSCSGISPRPCHLMWKLCTQDHRATISRRLRFQRIVR